MYFMECLERCLGHVMQLSLTDELCIGHMHSLPSAVIQTVKAAFKHCKVHLKKVHDECMSVKDEVLRVPHNLLNWLQGTLEVKCLAKECRAQNPQNFLFFCTSPSSWVLAVPLPVLKSASVSIRQELCNLACVA